MSRRAEGLRAWVIQRITAVYLALFGTYVVVRFIVAPPADHAALQAWVVTPWVSIGLLILIGVLLSHAWVGVRDVFMDYIHNIWVRVVALVLTAFVFVASGIWSVQAIIIAQLRSVSA